MQFSYLGSGVDECWTAHVGCDDADVVVQHDDATTGKRTVFKFAVGQVQGELLERLQAMSGRGEKAIRQLEKWAGTLDDLEAVKAAYATNQKGIWWATLQESLDVEPRYEHGKPHHVTLLYKVPYGAMAEWDRQVIDVRLTHLCHSDRVEAFKVVLPDGVPCDRVVPHITVSWVTGAAPASSIEMLEADYDCVAWSGVVQARIEFKPHYL